MADFEEKMLEYFEKNPVILRSYMDDTLFIWEYGEESLKVFFRTSSYAKFVVKFHTLGKQ